MNNADRSAIPDADLAMLLAAIERRREAGLCGRHQHSSQPGCAAVAVWASGHGPGGRDRPTALFCRDRLGRYSAFGGDGRLLASGSINDVIRWWR
jgi:hypothetical protein